MDLEITYKGGHHHTLIFSLRSFPWMYPHQHFAYIFYRQSPWFHQTSLALPLPESFFHAPLSFKRQEQRCPPAPAVYRCLKPHLTNSMVDPPSTSTVTALTGLPSGTPPPEIPKSIVFIAEDTLIKSNSTDKALENVKPVLPDKNVTIILPSPVDTNNPGKFEDLQKQSLEEALPFLLDHYAIPHDKVKALTDKGVGLFNRPASF